MRCRSRPRRGSGLQRAIAKQGQGHGEVLGVVVEI
jgi:hypothetical protein